jgi:hypothetical protein
VFAVYAIKRAAFVEVPIEAMSELADAIDSVRTVYTLETGAKPSDDELVSLFNFALLESRVPNWGAFAKYLEQFVVGLQQKDVALLDQRMEAAVTVFVRSNALLTQLMSK